MYRIINNIKEVNPLKQGLKLYSKKNISKERLQIKEVNPLKQGLKH